MNHDAGTSQEQRGTARENVSVRPFHLAFPVKDLEESRKFYETIPGCRMARTGKNWIDFDFLGHQITAHYAENAEKTRVFNKVDREIVPVPHFGVVVSDREFNQIRDALVEAGIQFLIEPTVRFRGQYAEQRTMFFADPSGNHLEIKSFRRIEEMF